MFVICALVISSQVFSQDKEKEKEREREKEKQEQEYWEQAAETAKLKAEEMEMKMQELLEHTEFKVPAPPAYGVGSEGIYVLGDRGSASSQLSLSKTFDGESRENKGNFEVEESIKFVSLGITGIVKSGEIRISIVLPGGDELKELVIDETADVKFSKSLRLDEEDKEYFGEWEYTVKATNAKGYYKISINTR